MTNVYVGRDYRLSNEFASWAVNLTMDYSRDNFREAEWLEELSAQSDMYRFLIGVGQ